MRRRELPENEYYLTELDLSGKSFARGDLCKADLSRARLTGTTLTRALMLDAILEDADASEADLSEAFLTRARAERVNFTHAKLHATRFDATLLGGAIWTNASLTGAGFPRRHHRRAGHVDRERGRIGLWRSGFSGAEIAGRDLTGCVFDDCAFVNADLGQTRCQGRFFAGAI